MRSREFHLQISPDEQKTLYVRVGEALVEAILQGRLKPGDSIPGSRTLAESLGINRNTVIEALEDLTEEGWLIKEPSRGTFVADPLPELGRYQKSMGMEVQPHQGLGFDLPSNLAPISSRSQEVIDLSEGVPAPELFSAPLLAKAYQRGLQRHGSKLLDEGDPLGHALLRETLAEWYGSRRGFSFSPSQVLVTRGSRASLALLSLALLKKGQSVAVESPGNRPAWEAILKCVGVQLVPIPVDGEGLQTSVLEEALASQPIRMLYLTPQRQVPTGAVLSPSRRAHLLELAARHRLVIIEDDAGAEYGYEESVIPPLASTDKSGQVIFMSSMAKILVPGLRLGLLVGHPDLISPLARVQRTLERQGDRGLEWAVADLIRDGEVDKHLRRARMEYRTRRDQMIQQLGMRFGDRLNARVPGGGLSLWIQALTGEALGELEQRAKAHGLLLRAPSHYYLEDPQPWFRMGFAHVSPKDLDEVMNRLEGTFG